MPAEIAPGITRDTTKRITDSDFSYRYDEHNSYSVPAGATEPQIAGGWFRETLKDNSTVREEKQHYFVSVMESLIFL